MLLDKVAKECRPGQDWRILRQAIRAMELLRKPSPQFQDLLAGTYLAVLKDNIPSFEVTTHSPMLPWTIRHAAWVLIRYSVRRETRMTPYEKIRGQKEILPLLNKFSLVAQEPT